MNWNMEGVGLEVIVGDSDDLNHSDPERVVSFDREPGFLVMRESCDGYFKARLDAAQVVKLIGFLNGELLALLAVAGGS